MTEQEFQKAQELNVRIAQLRIAIEKLEKAYMTQININGVSNSPSKMDCIQIDGGEPFLVPKSDTYFYRQRMNFIEFLKAEWESAKKELEAI